MLTLTPPLACNEYGMIEGVARVLWWQEYEGPKRARRVVYLLGDVLFNTTNIRAIVVTDGQHRLVRWLATDTGWHDKCIEHARLQDTGDRVQLHVEFNAAFNTSRTEFTYEISDDHVRLVSSATMDGGFPVPEGEWIDFRENSNALMNKGN